MTIKKIIGKVHLYLGLTSGLIVFIIAVTGCLYAFQVEIQNLTQPFRFVSAQKAAYLPPSQLQQIAQQQLPDKQVHSVQYGAPGNSAQVIFYHSEPEYYFIVYVDPYNGKVLKVQNVDRNFFRIVLMGHYYLWLPPAIGQRIVVIATVIFVVMMISGLILWWPKNKAAARQRFTIKWNARWRRKNYDLHNVLGFYMTWVAIFMAITGLVFGWEWLGNAIYHTAGGQKSVQYQEPVSDTTHSALTTPLAVVDKIWIQMQQAYPHAETLEVHVPPTAQSSVVVAVNPDADTYWKTDYRYFDQYTLQELPVQSIYGRHDNATAADKLIRMNYDIHVGAILGLPGKVLAFFASLIAASLPVTGFLIWRGRRRKEMKNVELKIKNEKVPLQL